MSSLVSEMAAEEVSAWIERTDARTGRIYWGNLKTKVREAQMESAVLSQHVPKLCITQETM